MIEAQQPAVENPAPSTGAPGHGGERVSFQRLGLGLLIGVSLLAIFVLPYRVSVPTPSVSSSWVFGYSNAAARDLIGLMLLLVFAWRLFLDRSPTRISPLALTLQSQPADPRPRPFIATVAAFQLLACALLTAWYCVLPYAYYGEMAYFMQRLAPMLLGRAPYRDFAFAYGPAMLWMPVFFYRASHAALSIEAAYLLTLLLHYILGFGLLAYAVSQLHSRARTLVFVLIAAPFFNPTMGLNYAPLRFAILPASLLAVRHLLRALEGSRWRIPAVALAGFLLPIANCAISPEMGIAVIGGLAVYFIWFLFGKDRAVALSLIGLAAGVAAVAAFFPRGMFDSIFSFGSGGMNFPLLPDPHILAMLACALWVLPEFGLIAVRGLKGPAGPFCAGFAVSAGLLLGPATGRCDAGHALLNTLGIFMVALAAATFLDRRWRYILHGGYILIFLVIAQYVSWTYYLPAFQRVWMSRQELARMSYVQDNGSILPPPPIHFGKLLPSDPWLATLPHVPIGLPLGADEVTERFLFLTGRALPEYYIPPHSDLYEPHQLARMFGELENMTYIYVPRYYLKYLRPADNAAPADQADSAYLAKLFFVPVTLKTVNPPFEPEAAIMRRIGSDYKVSQIGSAGILFKRLR